MRAPGIENAGRGRTPLGLRRRHVGELERAGEVKRRDDCFPHMIQMNAGVWRTHALAEQQKIISALRSLELDYCPSADLLSATQALALIPTIRIHPIHGAAQTQYEL